MGFPIASAPIEAILRVAGTFIEVDPNTFLKLVSNYKSEGLLIVHSTTGVVRRKHVYVTSIRGLVFYCESESLLPISVDVETKAMRVVKI